MVTTMEVAALQHAQPRPASFLSTECAGAMERRHRRVSAASSISRSSTSSSDSSSCYTRSTAPSTSSALAAARNSAHTPSVSTGNEHRRSILRNLKNRFKNNTPRSIATQQNATVTRTRVVEDSIFEPAPPTRRPDRPGMNAFTTPSTEPPPAYTAAVRAEPLPPSYSPSLPQMQTPARTNTNTSSSTTDDPYSFLGVFDTIFLIDDSGSMAGRSWRETSAALEALTPILVEHDEDGIDLHFLNACNQPHFLNLKDAASIHEIFNTVRPSAGTPTGMRLNFILKDYLRRYQADREGTKPLNVIVITDGVPSDDVESVIISTAKKLDALDADLWQVGIQFFQVGEEAGAQEHLNSLDDELSRMGGGCRDIVDTVPFVAGARGRGMGLTADGMLKVVLGAVNRRLDRQRNSSEALRT